jgi:hypothetical protein
MVLLADPDGAPKILPSIIHSKSAAGPSVFVTLCVKLAGYTLGRSFSHVDGDRAAAAQSARACDSAVVGKQATIIPCTDEPDRGFVDVGMVACALQ